MKNQLLRTSIVLLVLFAALAFLSPSAAQAAGPSIITVGWGDTLYSIAGRYNTSVPALVSANSLPNPDFIYA